MNQNQQKKVLEVIENIRSLSFHITSFTAKLNEQNTRIEQLNKDFSEIKSLKTAYDHQSEKLSANIEKMKTLIKNSNV